METIIYKLKISKVKKMPNKETWNKNLYKSTVEFLFLCWPSTVGPGPWVCFIDPVRLWEKPNFLCKKFLFTYIFYIRNGAMSLSSQHWNLIWLRPLQALCILLWVCVNIKPVMSRRSGFLGVFLPPLVLIIYPPSLSHRVFNLDEGTWST